jgi:hypothetical protein
MTLDSSNKRYSNIIAGILVISVLSIFMAFFMGFGDNNIYEQNRVQPEFVAIPYNSDEYTSNCLTGRKRIEPVTQCKTWSVDVKKGSMVIGQAYWDAPYQLPICTYAEEVNKWWMTVLVKGGYHPCTLCNEYIQIYQEDKANPGSYLTDIYYINSADMDWGTPTPHATLCGVMVYNLTFTLSEDPLAAPFGKDIDGDITTIDVDWGVAKCMLFHSNHKPFPCTGPTPRLGKMVTLKLCTCWSGCGRPPQNFEVLLVHKIIVSGIPNSRLKVSSPVLCNIC